MAATDPHEIPIGHHLVFFRAPVALQIDFASPCPITFIIYSAEHTIHPRPLVRSRSLTGFARVSVRLRARVQARVSTRIPARALPHIPVHAPVHAPAFSPHPPHRRQDHFFAICMIAFRHFDITFFLDCIDNAHYFCYIKENQTA